jgi:tRNA pseudouridine38-40 synthase
MRYFCKIAYNGTRFSGWQKQPNSTSIQAILEEKLSIVLRQGIEIIGCGRTDAGVHASSYYFHFDATIEDVPIKTLIYKLNQMCTDDIVIYDVIPVHDDAHARFDAINRSYIYTISKTKNIFEQETTWYTGYEHKLDIDKMNEAAKILLNYSDFTTFCKTNGDNKTCICAITHSEWIQTDTHIHYHITSDRFLRGMVRLIVGACTKVGLGLISIEELKYALEHRKLLDQSYTVPPNGLFLNEIKYSFL